MSSYPNPCDKCTFACSGKGCERWLTRYRYRQKQINAYAKKLGITPTSAPKMPMPVNPCKRCQKAETCTQICKARADYWDAGLRKIRQKLHSEERHEL